MIPADSTRRRRRLLLVAPMLGEAGRVPDVFEVLGPLLEADGHTVVAVSRRTGSLRRLLDMAISTVRSRRRTDVVVIHLYSGRAFAVADVVSRLAAGRRRIGVLAGGGLPESARRRPRWTRRALGRFDELVAPSEYLARWARSLADVPVTVIPNPLDTAPYPYRAREQAEPRLLWLRAYHDIYRPVVAVEAASRLRESFPDLLLTMVGDDKGERTAVERMVEDRGLRSHVTVGGFAGPADKRRLFGTNDVFVHTSAVDNRPVSVVEAAASGLCIVAAAVGGIPDLLRDGESALLVPPDDPVALADAIERVLSDPELARRLSTGARLVAEAGVPSRVVARWRDLLGDRPQ